MENSPEDGLSLAQVKTINLEALGVGDKEEQSRLFGACCDDGFFYLDIEGTTAGFGASVEEVYQLEHELFILPEQELLQYDIDNLSSKKLNGCAMVRLHRKAYLSNTAKV